MSDVVLIGIDDTDNLESRGTGYRARCLAAELETAGLGRVCGVTRHQLLVHEAIPYTSHNSSACLHLRTGASVRDSDVIDLCREFLCDNAAEGSDVGLCVTRNPVDPAVEDFGLAAQSSVLEMPQAETLARDRDIWLEGLTGRHTGVIGALAAVGLHSRGDDGRYIWVRGIREYADRVLSLETLRRVTGVEAAAELSGAELNDPAATIGLGPWPRPVRISGRATLLIEADSSGNADWKVVDKESIKTFRP